MNTQPIESGFAQMGARFKVREIPSVWRRNRVSWFDAPKVRHSDHETVDLPFWHRVLMNTETQSRRMANVAFLD